MTSALSLEIGPAVVRQLNCAGKFSISAEPALAAAALVAGADPLALLEDRVVATEALWRTLLTPMLAGAQRVRLVHPTWWPITRIEMLVAAAAAAVDDIETVARATLLARPAGDVAVIEIAQHLVLIVAYGAVLGAVPRSTAPGVVAEGIVDLLREHPVITSAIVDAPRGVPGAAEFASMLRARLAATDIAVEFAALPGPSLPLPEISGEHAEFSTSVGPKSNWLRWTAAAVLAVLIGLWVWQVRPTGEPPPRTTSLVEGPLAVDIPVGWTVRHIVGGHGSARVEVSAPENAPLAVLVTQSPVANGDLASTAETLRIAMQREPPGIFVDLNPVDHGVGRPAVTYRELRSDRSIRWTVVLDGGIRIGIGCQQAARAEDAMHPACLAAIRSARRIQ